MDDDLAEAERRARLLRETDGAHWVGLPPILDELDRLRLVEQAATTLVRGNQYVLPKDPMLEWPRQVCDHNKFRALVAAVRTETP